MPMPSYQDVYDEIVARAAEAATFTQAYRTQRLNRKNWQALANDGKLVCPYLIVETGREVPRPYAMDADGYALPVSLYLVSDLSEGAVVEAADACHALRSAFRREGFATFALMNEEPSVDYSDANPANAIFYDLQSRRFAGMVSFEAVVGCGVYVDA